ncbi:S41 family peptidase [Desertivirga brevis]|uniref:S41 family peptidase n=1 Tax=Desertivirga brevis TaxID=2810310 RepID=UPI001A95A764|nr:S41 family peptidase [Pedobacter sp. SYSU D00873]
MKVLLLVFSSLLVTNVAKAQTTYEVLGQKPVKPAQKKLPVEAVVSSLILELQQHYVIPEVGTKMARKLKSQLSTYDTITSHTKLAAELEKDLKSVYPDKHLYVSYDPDFFQPGKEKTEAEKAENRNRELVSLKEQNFMFTDVRILPRNIGYVRINGFFVNRIEDARPTVNAAFRFIENTKALILDLRSNGGGNPKMVNLVESYFFKDSTHINNFQDGSSNKIKKIFTNPAITGGLTLSMPLFILTGKRTFSGAEAMSYDLQQLNRAKVVGDTTAGGGHLTRAFALKEGFVAEIPYADSVNPYSGKNWELTGVIPDVASLGGDALIKAQELIYQAELSKTLSDREKATILWQIDHLKASHVNQPEISLLKKYCGKYEGGSEVFLIDGALHLKNGEMDGDINKLIPINNKSFVWDENIHIEFEENVRKGLVLKFIFMGGHVREKSKIDWRFR